MWINEKRKKKTKYFIFFVISFYSWGKKMSRLFRFDMNICTMFTYIFVYVHIVHIILYTTN